MRYFLSFFFLLCIASGAHATKLYKWVDAEGNVQFTQTPPPTGVEAESRTLRSTRTPPAQQVEDEDESEDYEDDEEEGIDKTSNQFIDKKNREIDAENCRRARKQIADLSVDVDLMTQDEKDPSKYIKLTKEARKQRIEQAKSYAEHYCRDKKNDDDE